MAEPGNRVTKLELLAPARDETMGKVAIDCGADAVYVGAPRFSARAAAGASLEGIERLVRYAHRYHARVYAAFNTILFDRELEEARTLITDLCHTGIDALIIQDMSILEMDLPPIPLHASTQTHNATPVRVKLLERAGFSRVILARELSLEQIGEIRKETSVELEAFVHGALCVSMSGRCAMSQAQGERSGNRGVCAQPCRKSYDLLNARDEVIVAGKHLLSLRDLDLSGYLPDLAAAGITSFKIEGRLKDGNYLRNITAWYRQKLDAFLGETPAFVKSSAGKVSPGFEPDPAKTFSRGTSSYFLLGRHPGITSFDTPKSAGERVAVVLSSDGRHARVKAEAGLHNNDGITFYNSDGILSGAKINKAEGNNITWAEAVRLSPGTVLYRNYDHQFSEMLRNSRPVRRIALKITLRETAEGLLLEGADEQGIILSRHFRFDKMVARDPAKAALLFREQMAKAGDTPFEVTAVEIPGDFSLFLPVSQVNALRRDFLEAFLLERERLHPVEVRRKGETGLSLFSGKIPWEENVANALAEQFYRKHGADAVEPALEISRDYRGRRLMTMKHCLKYQQGHCAREGAPVDPQWTEPLFLFDGVRKFRLEFDCRECVMNLYHL